MPKHVFNSWIMFLILLFYSSTRHSSSWYLRSLHSSSIHSSLWYSSSLHLSSRHSNSLQQSSLHSRVCYVQVCVIKVGQFTIAFMHEQKNGGHETAYDRKTFVLCNWHSQSETRCRLFSQSSPNWKPIAACILWFFPHFHGLHEFCSVLGPGEKLYGIYEFNFK